MKFCLCKQQKYKKIKAYIQCHIADIKRLLFRFNPKILLAIGCLASWRVSWPALLQGVRSRGSTLLHTPPGSSLLTAYRYMYYIWAFFVFYVSTLADIIFKLGSLVYQASSRNNYVQALNLFSPIFKLTYICYLTETVNT